VYQHIGTETDEFFWVGNGLKLIFYILQCHMIDSGRTATGIVDLKSKRLHYEDFFSIIEPGVQLSDHDMLRFLLGHVKSRLFSGTTLNPQEEGEKTEDVYILQVKPDARHLDLVDLLRADFESDHSAAIPGSSLPDILTVQVLRERYAHGDVEVFPMKYPLTLRVGDFAPSSPSRDLTYDLIGIVLCSVEHEPNKTLHYKTISFSKQTENNVGKWHQFDDDIVKQISAGEALSFTGQIKECDYINGHFADDQIGRTENKRGFFMKNSKFVVSQLLFMNTETSFANLNTVVNVPENVERDLILYSRLYQPQDTWKLEICQSKKRKCLQV
jgi:hypothetical protein